MTLHKVKRGNVILRVTENELDHYVSSGFDVVNEDGSIIKEGVTNDVGALKNIIQRKDAEIEQLKSEIERLKTPKNTRRKNQKKQETVSAE